MPDAATCSELPEEEAQHALKVLRLKEGDEMMLMDGKGCFYEARVLSATGKHCYYEVMSASPQCRQWEGHVHLAIAPTKMMERMEWLAEKATEVGIDELTFLDCRFSERRVVKVPRVEKIVVSAVKQDFKMFIAQHTEGCRYIAHCYDEVERVNLFDELRRNSRLSSLSQQLVLVGPEGDFSIEEVRMAVEAGFVSVDLGKSRLRTETAGLAAVMMMQLAKQG